MINFKVEGGEERKEERDQITSDEEEDLSNITKRSYCTGRKLSLLLHLRPLERLRGRLEISSEVDQLKNVGVGKSTQRDENKCESKSTL